MGCSAWKILTLSSVGMFVNSYVKHVGELPENSALSLLQYYDATGFICWFHHFHSLSCLTPPLDLFFYLMCKQQQISLGCGLVVGRYMPLPVYYNAA